MQNFNRIIESKAFDSMIYEKFNVKLSNTNKLMIIEDYNKAKDYLDDNFESNFLNEFSSRFLELSTALHILTPNYRTYLLKTKEWKRKKNTGPDFKILFKNVSIYIECVCPTKGDKRKMDTDPEYLTTINQMQGNFTTLTEKGRDTHTISRITNSIDDKIEKFENYSKNGIVEDGSYKILHIGGIELLLDKCRLFEDKEILPSCVKAFEDAIEAKTEAVFPLDDRPFDNRSNTLPSPFIESQEIVLTESEKKILTIQKGKWKGKDRKGNEELTNLFDNFDFFIYSELFSKNRPLSHNLNFHCRYTNQREIPDEIIQIIKSIFNLL